MSDKQREAFEEEWQQLLARIPEGVMNTADKPFMRDMFRRGAEWQAQQAADVDGCRCQQCGTKFMGDLLVPDDVWEQVKPAGKSPGSGILCPSCIVSNIVSSGIWSAATAFDVDQQEAGAEPVGYIHVSNNGHTAQLFYRSCDIQPLGEGEHNIYASPKPPRAVPDGVTPSDAPDKYDGVLSDCICWAEGWNDCRRAMLDHPGPSTTAFDDQYREGEQ